MMKRECEAFPERVSDRERVCGRVDILLVVWYNVGNNLLLEVGL